MSKIRLRLYTLSIKTIIYILFCKRLHAFYIYLFFLFYVDFLSEINEVD